LLLLYRIFFAIGLVLGSPFLLLKAVLGRHGVRERFGYIKRRESSGRLFWFHAASVGELKIISSIIPEIGKLSDGIDFAISTTTASGRKRAEELFGSEAHVFLQPLELTSAIRRVLETLNPEKLIIVETEIWPLLVTVARRSGVAPYLINARMSKSSFRAYRALKPFVGQVLAKFVRILSQTEVDADRFKALGAENAETVGNLKYDQVLNDGEPAGSILNLTSDDRLIFVAGSIRRGEYEIFADLIERSWERLLKVGFILVPRHMKDIDYVRQMLSNRRISFLLWSEVIGADYDFESVLLVNTMGRLRDFYRIADLAFVGGSLVPIGGHDPVEPAALGKPVIFGPYMDNAGEAAVLLLKSGGAVEVKGVDDLLEVLTESIQKKDSLARKGELCREAVISMTGASKKTARILLGDSS
jgi:3-deoxy-D-manno-octulosonic-acid transferase